jgi:hypothetical protein
MNIEAVNDAHALFKNGGYNGTIEDFQSLITTNDEALSDAHKLFSNAGYTGDIVQFSELVGVKKKDEALDSGSESEEVVTTSATEEVEQSTPSVSSSGKCPPGQVFNEETGECEDVVTPLPTEVETQEKPTLIERKLGKNTITDFLGDMYRAVEQGATQPVEASLDVFMQGKDITEEDLQNYIEQVQKVEELGQSDEMIAFQKTYQEEGSGMFGVLKGLYENPTIAYQVLLSSVASMIRPSVVGAGAAGAGTGAAIGFGAGAIGGPLSGVTAYGGAVTGGIIASTATLETALTFNELLQEELDGQAFTQENVRKVLNDPEKLKKIRLKAGARGAVIGIIDGITGGLAGKATTKIATTTGRKVLGAGTGIAIEAVGGSAGEAAGKAVAGQEMDVADIALEGIAGTATAPITVGKGLLDKPFIPANAKNLLNIQTGTYTINGQQVDKQFMVDMINEMSDEDISSSSVKIEIKDDEGTSQLLNDRLKKYELNQSIPSNITEEADRQELSNLEAEKAKLKNQKTQSARNRESQIDERIKQITDKYPIETEVVTEDTLLKLK